MESPGSWTICGARLTPSLPNDFPNLKNSTPLTDKCLPLVGPPPAGDLFASPDHPCRNWPQILLCDRVRSPVPFFQKQDRFLNVLCKQIEIHDLRQSGRRHVATRGSSV